MATRNQTNLTESAVTRAKPRARKYEIACKRVPGFTLRVLPSGKKSYYVRFRSPENGKDTRERIGEVGSIPFATARQCAIERLADVEGAVRGGRRAAPTGTLAQTANRRANVPTVESFAARFMAEHVRVRLKPNTITKYGQLFRTSILPAFASHRLDEVTRAEVTRWHAAKRATPYEANHALVVMKSMYSHALDWGVLPESFVSPASRVKKFPEKSKERYLTPEERERLERFFDKAVDMKRGRGGYRWESICALRLLSHTGMRRNEVLGLTWPMVDWQHGALVLPDSKVGRRRVPLSRQALDLLHEARDRENPSRYVVPNSHGEKIDGPELTRTWSRLRKHVGLEDVRLHDLRHSAASDAISSGVPLAVVGKILGHNKASTTQRYAHISDDALERGVATMGETIARNASGAGSTRRPRRAANKAKRSGKSKNG